MFMQKVKRLVSQRERGRRWTKSGVKTTRTQRTRRRHRI
jgi:hypothetical protein